MILKLGFRGIAKGLRCLLGMALDRVWRCGGLMGCANVRGPSNSPLWFLLGGGMKKLAAMVFFAMVAGNAMAQAGGASTGAGGGAGGAATGATEIGRAHV